MLNQILWEILIFLLNLTKMGGICTFTIANIFGTYWYSAQEKLIKKYEEKGYTMKDLQEHYQEEKEFMTYPIWVRSTPDIIDTTPIPPPISKVAPSCQRSYDGVGFVGSMTLREYQISE